MPSLRSRPAIRPNLWTPICCEVPRSAQFLAYATLDPRVRLAARRAYRLFAENPGHPSLRFKRLQAYSNVWSVRINEQYRAAGVRDGDTISWAWIGSHNDFDRMFG